MDEIIPREKAEWYRAFDREILPLLRDVANGSIDPEARAFDYNPERWALAMDWMERRASIDLLRGLKMGEPPLTDPRHPSWQESYDKFKERILGFIKLRASGIVDNPETVFFVVSLLQQLSGFTTKALKFLDVKEREHLGEAERPPETEVVLAEREE